MNWARRVDFFVYDLKILLTRPPVEKLLPDRPPLPPGAAYPKTLVLNLRGTLIHSEYKFGTGFEILKRPGLSVFLQRMSKYYEIVIFGDEENGVSTASLPLTYLNRSSTTSARPWTRNTR